MGGWDGAGGATVRIELKVKPRISSMCEMYGDLMSEPSGPPWSVPAQMWQG
jgi:hypothetical protein